MSESQESKVAVVHLIWLPYGIDLFASFIASYKEFDGGYPHSLVLLFNGVKTDTDTVAYRKLADQHGLSYVAFSMEHGSDLDAYFWVAPQLDSDYLLFLNTYSEVLSPNWIAHYLNAAGQQGVGVVSATGSYYSLFSMAKYVHPLRWSPSKSFNFNIRKYKYLLKNFFLYRFYFPPFPNPHVRTNGFFIRRDLFLSLRLNRIRKKYDAYRFESGWNSLTRQLMKKGLRPVIIDRFGKVYEIEQWYESCTFWTDEQKNLLISDNQTRKFMEAGPKERELLIAIAWGHGKV
jgi:hypothetical protein